MNLVQSYFTSVMKGEFSLYEIRIFVRIVALANQALNGEPAKKYLGSAVCLDGVSCNIVIPIKSILTAGSCDYGKVKAAVRRMISKQFELHDTLSKKWHCTTLLNDVTIAQGDGMIRFVVPKWLLEYILNFVNCNFTTYDMEAALSLPTPYCVRLYWLTCSMENPITYSLKLLKDILGVSNKYPVQKDFFRRVIDPAQELLKFRSLNGFTYKKVLEKHKVVGVTFYPVVRQSKKATQVVAPFHTNMFVPKPMRDYLTHQCGFKLADLEHHKAMLFAFTKLPKWQDRLVDIEERARKQQKSNGWVIQAMRGECTANGLEWQ